MFAVEFHLKKLTRKETEKISKQEPSIYILVSLKPNSHQGPCKKLSISRHKETKPSIKLENSMKK